MRRYLVISVLIVSAILPAAAHALQFNISVRFHGIEYIGDYLTYGRDPTEDDLGPEFGRVTCDIVDLYNRREPAERTQHCLDQEGGASSVRVGTPVYTLHAYRPEYRLAARVGERLLIFYASQNPRAKVGADMLDFEKKVARITVSLESSVRARSQWSSKSVQDGAQVEKLTRMMLAAPVMNRPATSAGASRYRYWITLWFKDGTAQGLTYFPDTGWLTPGLQMSEEFRRLVEQQLPPN